MKVKAKINAGFPAKPYLFTPERPRDDDVKRFEELRARHKQTLLKELGNLEGQRAKFSSREDYLREREKLKAKLETIKNEALRKLCEECVWLPVEDGDYAYRFKKDETYEHADNERYWELFDYEDDKSKSSGK